MLCLKILLILRALHALQKWIAGRHCAEHHLGPSICPGGFAESSSYVEQELLHVWTEPLRPYKNVSSALSHPAHFFHQPVITIYPSASPQIQIVLSCSQHQCW